MWHVDHISQAEQILSDTVDELKRLKQSNSLRDADRLIYAQEALHANKQLAVMAQVTPASAARTLDPDPDLKMSGAYWKCRSWRRAGRNLWCYYQTLGQVRTSRLVLC